MYTKSILSTIAATAALATALPPSAPSSLAARQNSCFPWYLNPQNDGSCQTQGTPPKASGPAPGRKTTCESLGGNWGAMAINLLGNDGNHCGITPYQITLYTTLDCTDEQPFNTIESSCFTAPQGTTWVAFTAEPAIVAESGPQ